MGRNTEYNWAEIKQKYIEGMAWSDILSTYGMSRSTLFGHFEEGKWDEERIAYQQNLVNAIAQEKKTKTVYDLAKFYEQTETGADLANHIAKNEIAKIGNRIKKAPKDHQIEKGDIATIRDLLDIQQTALSIKRLANNIPAPRQVVELLKSPAPEDLIEDEVDLALQEMIEDKPDGN